jgi:hypothetical protein
MVCVTLHLRDRQLVCRQTTEATPNTFERLAALLHIWVDLNSIHSLLIDNSERLYVVISSALSRKYLIVFLNKP